MKKIQKKEEECIKEGNVERKEEAVKKARGEGKESLKKNEGRKL